MYKIEKGIEIPSSGFTDKSSEGKYPLKNMEVGDSFLVPVFTVLEKRNVASNYGTFGRKHSMQFCHRSVDEGLRVWRIK